jgi:hypothetical protein
LKEEKSIVAAASIHRWFNELEINSTSTLSETTDSNNNKLAKLSSEFVSGGAEGKRMDDFCPYIKQEMQKEISMLLLSRDIVIELIQNSLIAEPILFLCGQCKENYQCCGIHIFSSKKDLRSRTGKAENS